MNKKAIIVILIGLNLSLFSGCSFEDDESVSGCANKDTEMLEALDKNIISIKSKSTNSKPNDDLVEMRHWKYGVKGPVTNESGQEAAEGPGDCYPTSGYDYETSSADSGSNNDSPDYANNTANNTYNNEVVSIQILTEEEMDAIIAKLVNSGYLEYRAITEEEFHEALRSCQLDHGLKNTGTLDTDTLCFLKKQ